MHNLTTTTLSQQGEASGGIPPNNKSGSVDDPAGQCQIELPELETMDCTEDLTGEFTVDEILECLSAPVTEPSVLATNGASDMTPQGNETFTAPAKKRSSKYASRRIYTDDEMRERRRIAKRLQRERQKQGKNEMQQQISEATIQIEAARLENDSLLYQHNALNSINEYCSNALHVAQNLVSSAIGKVQSQYQIVKDGLWWLGLQVYSPSDAQLHAFLDSKSLDELDSMSEQSMQRSFQLVLQWEAEAAARVHIEAQLQKLRVIRLRVLSYLARTRPDVVVHVHRRRLMPAGPDGAPNPKLVEAVAALNLTPEQLESLEQEWTLYLQNTGPLRQEVRSIISFLTSSPTSEQDLAFSFGAAGLFMDRMQAVQELELHPSNEARVLSGLISWIPSNLTMQQKVCLVRHCVPHFPDIIQIGRILFGDEHSSAAATLIE